MNLARSLEILDDKGYVIFENIFTKKFTSKIKLKLEKILQKRIKNNEMVGHNDNQVMYNYFIEDKSLIDLIHIPKVDKILKKLLEPNYVLQSTNAQNRIKEKIDKKIKLINKYKIGATWHTDSRYLNNRRLSKGFSYLVIIALDPFNKLNGPTKFIEKSMNYRSRPKRRLKLKYKELIMKEGSVCIMDTGIWHKGGASSSFSRWSIFSIYTGWFVKPYYNYQKYIKLNKLSKKYKKLLHYYSTPPEFKENRGTVISIK
tara:strand:- start:164 stop:937 length:774 start_codon:yes stop_codon:yes gene_type:complete